MAPAQPRVELGPTGQVVAQNIKRIRSELGMTLRDLALRLEQNGHAIAHSGLSKIENETRRVDTDDLVAVAVALGVSPLALLLPSPADPRSRVQVTGARQARAFDVWKWAAAGEPLTEGTAAAPESVPWWLNVEAGFALAGMRPAGAEEPRRGIHVTRTVTLEDDDPRIPFLVRGETLEDEMDDHGFDQTES